MNVSWYNSFKAQRKGESRPASGQYQSHSLGYRWNRCWCWCWCMYISCDMSLFVMKLMQLLKWLLRILCHQKSVLWQTRAFVVIFFFGVCIYSFVYSLSLIYAAVSGELNHTQKSILNHCWQTDKTKAKAKKGT